MQQRFLWIGLACIGLAAGMGLIGDERVPEEPRSRPTALPIVGAPRHRPAELVGFEGPSSLRAGDQPAVDAIEEPTAVPETQLARDLPVGRSIIEQASSWMGFSENSADALHKRTCRGLKVSRGWNLEQSGLDIIAEVEAAYAPQLASLADQIVEAARSSTTEFYATGSFPCRDVKFGLLEPRSKPGGWAPTAIFEFDGYFCDLSFRPADYPHLQQLLGDAQRLRDERDHVTRTLLGL